MGYGNVLWTKKCNFARRKQTLVYTYYNNMKELLIVSLGSFFGGGMRYGVSKLIATHASLNFPVGTFTVNVVGSVAVGFVAVVAGHLLAKSC